MSTERLIDRGAAQSEAMPHANSSPRQLSTDWIFEELPRAVIVAVSKPDTADFSPMLLSYAIELQYRQFKWTLVKKASQVLYLHFAMRKREFIEELHEMQEQVTEWLHSIGIVDQMAIIPDIDEPDDGAVPLNHEERAKNRHVSSKAALPIIKPTLGKQQTISDRAKMAMHNYLNHFLGNLDIVNSQEVCEFLEVSKLSFSPEYGPKLKEGYVLVKHLGRLSNDDTELGCFPCKWFGFRLCNNKWQKVWSVLKVGFLAFFEQPYDLEPLDIIIFDPFEEKESYQVQLAYQIKEQNPLYHAFKVCCGNSCTDIRTSSNGKSKSWVSAINNTSLRRPHRFESFAPPRGLTKDGSQAQWFIDGEAAFKAIASAIKEAKAEIFLTGWWLCPELYLKRPFHDESDSRLDALLEAKAKQGVQIYILLYKEVPIALKINSLYSKKKLLNIHENVRVLRYPDHVSTGIYLWSHHEKLVIIDYQICFLGGLDLCFGRYDTIEHKVGDCPPTLWPGKDYYNPRESEPNSWEDAMTDELERRHYPRMPWHDVHCALWGPPCRDVARHFVQRWNHAKKSKAPNEQTIPLLIPWHHMVLPHYLGRSKEIDIKVDKDRNVANRQNSFSTPSLLDRIPLLLPQEAEQLLPVREIHEIKNGVFDKSVNLNPDDQLFGFVDEIDFIDNEFENRNSERLEMFESNQEEDVLGIGIKQTGPQVSCQCQIVRSVSQWSAGTSRIEDSIHKSHCALINRAKHFIYIENQFFISGLSGDEVIQNRVLDALYNRIIRAHKEKHCFRVIVVIPLMPGFQGGLDDGGAATVRAITHWQYRTISREKSSILHYLKKLLGDKTHDYISFYGLRSHGRLFDGGPLATSQVYVHSKVMIIDDRIAFIGSSNINDRSLLGSRDSEIGVIIEDNEFVESSMNGKKWKAGKFSYSLRTSLWAEHLGLGPFELDRIEDPIADATYKDLWQATAKANTTIYHDVFACIPNDPIRSRAALRQSVAKRKEKIAQNTIDQGIAPEKLELEENGKTIEVDSEDRLRLVRGHLVSFPLEFMSEQDDLRPALIESEFYAGPLVFH